jgi:pyruvate/2-oxoacid:ferredoxin oxidoreductase beta subunit
MAPTTFTRPHGKFHQHKIVCNEYPVSEQDTAVYRMYNRGIIGRPKKCIDAIKADSRHKGPVLYQKMLYCLTFVESQMFRSQTNARQTVNVATSIYPAFSHGLFLTNSQIVSHPESSEVRYVGLVAEQVYDFFLHHWENYPK